MCGGLEFQDGVERDQIWVEQKNIVIFAQFRHFLCVNIKEGAKDRYFNREHNKSTRNWLVGISLEGLH